MSFSPVGGLPGQQIHSVIKILIILTCVISITCTLLDAILGQTIDWSGLRAFLGLSLAGFHHYYFWQVVTYMFVLDAGDLGFSIFFILSLLFNMYIVLAMGSSILDSVGSRSFLRFYIFIGILSGFVILLTMNYTHDLRLLSGPTPSILAILTVWSMIYPDRELLFFFLFPVKAKWLTLLIISLGALIPASHLDGLNLAFNTIGVFLGYIYAAMVWQFKSPFNAFHHLDATLNALGNKLQSGGAKALTASKTIGNKAKIFDFTTGEPLLKDDEFVEAMLTKISKQGEPSLSFTEKKRLNEISQRKRKKL